MQDLTHVLEEGPKNLPDRGGGIAVSLWAKARSTVPDCPSGCPCCCPSAATQLTTSLRTETGQVVTASPNARCDAR